MKGLSTRIPMNKDLKICEKFSKKKHQVISLCYPSVMARNIVPFSGNPLMYIFIEISYFITKWKDNLPVYE